MAETRSLALEARIADLERDLRELRLRVIALERLTGAGSEHAADEATVRRKVTYDWQG